MADNNSSEEIPTIMSAKEAAKLLGVHYSTLYESAKRGEIPCRRVGRRFLFERQTLIRWLQGPATTTE